MLYICIEGNRIKGFGAGGADDAEPAGGTAEPAGEPPADDAGEAAEPEAEPEEELDVVEELLQQFEAEDISLDQRRRLASQLDYVLQSTEQSTTSMNVRLRKLESQMQGLSSYADALEGVIDRFGPADEFLGDIRGSIESLDSAIEDIRQVLERTGMERGALKDRLDNLEDDIAVLDSRYDRVSDRIDTLRRAHRSKVSKLENKVEQLELVADKVEDMESELAELRDAVETGEARRRAIVRALSEDESLEE